MIKKIFWEIGCSFLWPYVPLCYPAWQLELTGKYDTIVYLRKEETDKLKYYLIVDRYLFSILTLLHSLSGENRKLIKFSSCCQGNKVEKKELKGYKNPGLVKYFLPNALPHYCSSEEKRKLIKFSPCCQSTRATWEIPANLPGKFSLSGQIFLHWTAATLKGLVEFQNKKLDHFSPSYLTQKCWFQDLRF